MYDDDGLERREIFTDGESLDAEAASAILRPYPELLEQWQAKLYKRWSPGQAPGPSRSPMLYSPTYLRAVVEEYLILRNGGDQIDPGLAAYCEQIAAARPEVAEDRRSYLGDPWARAQRPEMLNYRPATVADYYDPEYLQTQVDFLNRSEDPFDEVGIWVRERDARWKTRSLEEAEAPWN